MKSIAWLTAIVLCVLLCSCAFALEDTAVLPQLIPVEFPENAGSPIPENAKNNYLANQACFSEDGMSYHDDTLDIKAYQIRAYDTPCTVIFVQIADPMQLRTELAKPYPSKSTMRIFEISRRVNAVVSINGDWFTYHNLGIIWRNGEKLREREDEESDGLVIDTDGNFHIVRPITKENYEKLDVDILHSFAFGPALVLDGEVLEIINRKVTYKQRSAIGQIGPLSYVLVSTDGPDQKDSVGLSVPQLAQLLHDLGAQVAYNLDGGQSTSIMLNLVKLNGQAPKTMRAIGDIIYFTTGIASQESE